MPITTPRFHRPLDATLAELRERQTAINAIDCEAIQRVSLRREMAAKRLRQRSDIEVTRHILKADDCPR